MEPPAVPTYQVPPPAPRGGVPVWVWVVLAGCGCGGFFLVAILAAILFPVFAQSRETARGRSCMVNLRSQATAVAVYAQDYDERLPLSINWMDAAEHYVRNPRVFHCPSVGTDQTLYGYAYNSRLNGLGSIDVVRPSTQVMLFDSTVLLRNASDAVASLPSPGRHRRRNNMAYFDGHVAPVPAGAASSPD